MRVLITGGAGYVGSRVAAHLVAAGFEVAVFDRLDFGGEALLPLFGHPAFRLIQGDVRDGDGLAAAMEGCQAIVMLAGIVGEPACLNDPVAAEAINRDAAIEAIRRADALGAERFLFFSTCSNYGVLDPAVVADEDTPLNPISLYARTKVEVERFALAEKRRLSATVLRLGTICGLSARMRFDLLVNDLARRAALDAAIELYKPEAWRPFLHIDDVGRAVEYLFQLPAARAAGRVFNVVGGNYQKTGLAELVRKHFPGARIAITDASPDNRDYRVSGERIGRELGFLPAHSIENAFLEVAAAVRDGVFADPMWAGYGAIPLGRQPMPVAV